MSDDTDTPPEREMKDFQFRQMKKTRVFEPAEELPKDRSSLLTVSNKFGLTFVALDKTFKVYLTADLLAADKSDGNPNETVKDTPALAEVTVELTLHHLALSCDELTLSVCGMSEEMSLSLTFYDVRTFVNKSRPQKFPFASLQPAVPTGTAVLDLKWNPAHVSMLAACLSDGSMMILDVTDSVKVQAELPASSGITCICWSPKGKQVAAGKMNATVSQYTPALEEKKVIQCPHFYTSDEPVKALDLLWLRTFVFAVVYAAADGSLETPPELVLISLPKKDEKVDTKYLNFGDSVYGSCTERQYHYFLSHVEDWDLVFAASAASIEVSVIARQDDKMWELWLLEDASRAELPVTETNEDTLPLGLAIDYTSQQEIHITDEKTLPPAPIMLMLSTDGLLCPFVLLNLNPGVKQLVSPPAALSLEGERAAQQGSSTTQPAKIAASLPPAPTTFPGLSFTTPAATSTPAFSCSTAPFSVAPQTSSSSSAGFSFSIPTTSSSTLAPSAFSLRGPPAFASGFTSFSFAPKPPSPLPAPQSLAAPSPPTVKLNLNERFSAVEPPVPAFSFSSSQPKTVVPSSSSLPSLTPSATKPAAALAPVHPVQSSTPPTVIQKPAPAAQSCAQPPQAAVSVKALEKQLQQKKDSDAIMSGILEEIAHFQKELDDLKARSAKADFKVGTNEDMKDLRKASEDLHIFTLQIKETTESLLGDIGTLKTTLLEGFAGAEEAKSQNELSKDRTYRQLLYKKPLDPRSEEQLKGIRRLYQYVMFAVEDVNVVLDVEWEKHLEMKKKQKHMVVPGREGLFATLSNNLYIINQQKKKLDQLVKQLTALHLYSKTAAPLVSHSGDSAPAAGLESELESLRDALLQARLDSTPPKVKSPAVKISTVKQSQLRNFLSKGQMPRVRSTAPANLSRSAFLSPKYYEDLDDVSSTSSLSQALESHPHHLDLEEEELQPLPVTMSALPPSLANPRHPTVVRTPSIQPGFGTIQSTPLTKIHSVQSASFGISPIPSPIPTNKINLSGADSTALATKTVKHGAPPTERMVPVTIPAQQAAALAALQRQKASQKTAIVSGSLTESTLKTVPQVVNVQELKEKGPVPVSSIISSSLSDSATPAFAAVSSNQAKRYPTQVVQKMSSESSSSPQSSFVFGQPSKTDVSAAPASSVEQTSSKAFSFTSGSPAFSFTSVSQGSGISQVKDASKFSFGGGNGKMVFGPSGNEPFSLTPKSTSPALGNASPTLVPSSSDGAKLASATTAAQQETQPLKPGGGETLGSFSGLRVGQGEEAKDAKPAAAFSFGDSGLGMSKVVAQFGFGAALQKPSEESAVADLSASGSLFKPPEAKPAFPAPQAVSPPSPLPTSFSSLLAAPSESPEEPEAPPQPSEPTPPPEKEPAEPEPVNESPSAPAELEPAVDSPAAEEATPAETTAAPPPDTMSATPEPPPTVPPAAEETPSAAATTEAPPDSTTPAAEPTPAVAPPSPVSQVAPAAFQTPSSEKPGSIFTQPAPVTTDSSTVEVTPVICTAAPTVTTSALTAVSGSTTTAPNPVFGQSAAPPASAAQPASTGFSSSGFGAATGNAFGKSVFGQVSGFGQPATNSGSASSFSFTQSAFGSGSATTGGGGGSLFGAPTASNASSFTFGTSGANTASSTAPGLFGPSSAPAFDQSSAFGQPLVFGSNTTTSSASGFSFGQPSAFGCSIPTSVFGQQQQSTGIFGQQQQQQQQPSSGGSLFGSVAANTSGSSVGGGFFSGLGGKPSEDAANKNPFGSAGSTGGFGQSAQSGTTSLFGNSGAKTFGFGQSSFGEQKQGGTFSTGGGSVASQGFGSFSTPAKTGGFGSAAVFGSPPSFGGSPAFGGAASFGSGPSFSNTMGSPMGSAMGSAMGAAMGSTAGKVFGEGTAASSMGGFGFASPPSASSFGALANQSAPSFGSLAQQGSGFGAQPSSFSGFGQQPQAGGFPGNTFGSANQSSSQTFASWRS